MTANAMSEDRAACIEAGMEGYVSKAIRPAELVAELEATPALRARPAEARSSPANPEPRMAKRKAERKAPDELTAAKARIADLEALEAERSHAVLVQAALYRIAEAASAADDLPAFYRTIHEIVGELMYAENMYIALYDDERGLMNYPYYVDAFDVDVPDPNAWEAFGVGQATGVTAYALRRGEPLLIDGAEYQRLRDTGQIELLGVTSIESTWLGAPLRAEGRLLGLLVVQSYSTEHTYTHADLDLLAFVGQHVASALTRARAIEDATAERRAGGHQRDRRCPRQAARIRVDHRARRGADSDPLRRALDAYLDV